ncbi:MAG: ArsR family transcriptional regulator [Halolamina sp.]
MSRPEGESAGADADDETDEPAAMAPADAFALLGNDTRIDILQALQTAAVGDETPVAFSELFDRVDVDDSAHFNYHLKKLTDHFVRKTEAGYEFRTPGRKVVRAVFAGTFTGREELEPFDAPGECWHCGGALEATYADERLTVECVDCDRPVVSHTFAPGGVADRDPEELLEAFHHHVRHHYCLAADGVCPECMGRMETHLTRESTFPGREVEVNHVCGRCDTHLRSAVGLNLLDTAPVLSFHAERGVDLSTEPFWTFAWCVSDERTAVVGEDPLTLRLEIPVADDEIRVTVDETLDVLDVERRV